MMAKALHRTGWISLMVLLVGCASSSGRLTVSPAQDAPHYEQTFQESLVRRASDGQYDILLIDEAQPPASQPGTPLQPTDLQPLRQVVHLRVHWRPRGVRADHPSATNASIDWYVFGTGVRGEEDLLHYRGAGFVKLYPGKQRIEAQVRTAELSPSERRGAIVDPIGRSQLTGVVYARRDADAVERHLEQLQQQLAPTAPAAAHHGPPARKHAGP